MLIGIVSDTHGQVEFTRRAVRMLEALEVERVLHCGDIGSAAIVPLFAAWPAHFVYGNVDYDREALGAAIAQAGQTCHGELAELDFAGRRIAMLHGDDVKRLNSMIGSGEWDLVCHGHTHVARVDRRGEPGGSQGGTLVINPGALFRAARHTIAVVKLPELEAEIIAVT
jgi:putative phosphoesterase